MKKHLTPGFIAFLVALVAIAAALWVGDEIGSRRTAKAVAEDLREHVETVDLRAGLTIQAQQMEILRLRQELARARGRGRA